MYKPPEKKPAPPRSKTNVISLSAFMARKDRDKGKTANFYFSDKDEARFRRLQQRLGYANLDSAAMRAILELADIVVEKIYDDYVVRVTKPGKATLRLKL